MNCKQLCFVIHLVRGKIKTAFTGELDHSACPAVVHRTEPCTPQWPENVLQAGGTV